MQRDPATAPRVTFIGTCRVEWPDEPPQTVPTALRMAPVGVRLALTAQVNGEDEVGHVVPIERAAIYWAIVEATQPTPAGMAAD